MLKSNDIFGELIKHGSNRYKLVIHKKLEYRFIGILANINSSKIIEIL